MENILFQCTKDDIPYLGMLKPLLSGRAAVTVSNKTPVAMTEVWLTAKSKGATKVVTSCPTTLKLLLQDQTAKIDDYAGSLIDWTANNAAKDQLEVLIVHPVEHLLSVTYGKFLYERYLSKFLKPSSWMSLPKFSWQLFEPSKTEDLLSLFATANFIAADIETGAEEERIITCISFAAVHIDAVSKSYTITTVVVPFTDLFNIAFTRSMLGLSVPKVFQNGQYDQAYLLRYGIKTTNWLFDTKNLFHSWYSELPKRLDFITSFTLRKTIYWKGMSKTNDLMIYYEYNARDSYNTALALLSMLTEVPEYAWTNYFQEFPVEFPCLMAGLRGLKINPITQARLATNVEASFNKALNSLRIMVGNKDFNPGSWQQTQKLFEALGSGDIKGTGKIPRDKVMARHPLNRRILTQIDTYRSDRKLFGSYVGKEIVWDGRLFYSLDPSGTDTSRLASRESQFWCGIQIQNIPRDDDEMEINIKEMFEADSGFVMGECDYSQAETWDTAYISGDVKLLEAVNDRTKDFHGRNASEFFGIPYDKIVNSSFDEQLQEWIHSTLDKAIRNLSKRTNHGANYNMMAQMLLDTMGIQNVIKAKTLLGLPANLSLIGVTTYLLKRFDETYPVVRGDYYTDIKNKVASTGMLVSAIGTTRKCFGNPSKSKLWMNAYAAHPSQHLNAVCLNRSYRRVFHEIALDEPDDFKLGPQIHDSILFQYRIGRTDLAFRVKNAMEFQLPVRDIFGITRTLSIPVDLKGEGTNWSNLIPLREPKVSVNA